MRTLLCILILLIGCQTREIGAAGDPESRKLVFADDFSTATLSPRWKRGTGESGAGQWAIKDGWLTGSQLKNDPLWLQEPLSEKVRIEFDAQALSADGDLKFEIFGDGATHASGYIVIFGGWKNSLDVIARLDEHGKDRLAKPSLKVQPNRTYHIAVERTDNTLRWFVDGNQVLAFVDADPLVGSAHQFFAFSNWNAPVRFDNLRIYALK